MTDLTPIAHALHAKIWPLVARRAKEQCKTIDEENTFMNISVPYYAPYLSDTPFHVLACIWGVSDGEAIEWRDGIRWALTEAARPGATKESVYRASCSRVRWP